MHIQEESTSFVTVQCTKLFTTFCVRFVVNILEFSFVLTEEFLLYISVSMFQPTSFFFFFYQEYLVSEIFFHSSVLRLFNTSEWCTSICEARPLSVMQVRSCLSKSSIKSDGAPKNRKSLRRAHTLARFGRTTSVLHCLAKRSQVAVQSLPNVQSVLTWQARPLRNARTVASGTTLPRSSILQS